MEGEGEAQPKKGRGKLIIIALVVLVALGGGGFFGYSKLKGKETKYPEAQNIDKPGEKVEFKPFVVNLMDDGQFPHYFKIELEMVLKDGSNLREIEVKKGELRDVVIVLLSSKRKRDLVSIEGKDRLRDEIVNRVNSVLRYATVNRIFFKDFIIQ